MSRSGSGSRRTTSTGTVLSVAGNPTVVHDTKCPGVLMIDCAPVVDESDDMVPIGDGQVFPLRCCQPSGHHEMDPCVDDMGIEFWPEFPMVLAQNRHTHPAYRDHDGVQHWQGAAVTDIREVLRG